MNIKELIAKKNSKKELTRDELVFLVNTFLSQKYDKTEMKRLMESICKNSMNDAETYNLTDIMIHSGSTIDLSDLSGKFVDKHSSGGVSDTTTLILAPMIASCGLKMLKMSGRSLAHTGGTIDKLEVFDNLKTATSIDSAKKIINKIGVAIISQTDELVPADKIMYKFRDETGTTGSIPLIASSIMSKKLASGADYILLDIKCGEGALLRAKKESLKLARLMVKIGKRAGKHVVAYLTNMNQPLGNNIGDVLEVNEAINVLAGKETGNLYDLCCKMCAELITLTGIIKKRYALNYSKSVIKSGDAQNKLKDIVKMQGGQFSGFELDEKKFVPYFSLSNGYIKSIDAKKLGLIVHKMRAESGKSAGIRLNKKVGDKINTSEKLFEIYDSNSAYLQEIAECFEFSSKKVKKEKIIIKIIR